MNRRLSRRRLLGWAGAGAALAGTGAVTACSAEAAPVAERVVPFRGDRQAGIVTPAQDRLHFVALDLTTGDRERVRALLQKWTTAAERMTAGAETAPGGATGGNPDSPPADTGEALGLPATSLTLTFGVGPGFFDKLGLDPALRPPGLADLPHFTLDQLDPALSGGDLCIQACADDPQVAVHAVRNLVRIGFGTTAVRWSQLGFGRTSSTSTTQDTPRNLFGFKDGTRNLKAEDPAAVDEHVWVSDGADAKAGWLTGGTYLVARRINMTIEIWDRQPLREQEKVIGRTKAEGAPLSGGTEFSQPDFALTGRGDEPLVATDAHVRLVHPDQNGGVRMLRRGYNFVDGSNRLGRMDAGLFFLAFVCDPRSHFIPIQTRIGVGDAMSEYLQHTGSALFAVPPGVTEGEYVGQALFA